MASPARNPENFEKFQIDEITLYIEKKFLEQKEIEFLIPYVKKFIIGVEEKTK